MAKRSRYADVNPFDPDPLGRTSFKGLLPRSIARTPGAIEQTIVAGERLDQLSLSYFNDDRYWWRIVDANVGFLCGTDMTVELSTVEEEQDPFGRSSMISRPVIVPPKEG
jgi:hypothetical protein